MANLMFDTKLRKSEYDRMNHVVAQSTLNYYLAATFSHLIVLSYSAYFFRFRRLNKVQVLAVGSLYWYGFNSINSTLYSLLVDRKVV